jgi:hypothetical protein
VPQEGSAKYRRLIPEGLMIVLSILLAFGIEAAWQERLERGAEAEAVASLRADFEENRRLVRQVIDAHLGFRATVAVFVELPQSAYDTLPPTRASEFVLAAANPWTFDPVLGATDALVGAGRTGLLRDTELRDALSDFLGLVADLPEDAEYVSSSAQDVWSREAVLGGPWTDPSTEVSPSGSITGLPFIPRAEADDLRTLRGDQLYMSLVKRYHLNAAYYVRELERLEEHIDYVLRLVEEQSGRAF